MDKTNPFKKQFEKDLKANEVASDKLDKELNKPAPFLGSKEEFEKATKVVDEEKKTPKDRILEEFGGLEANIPKYHHYWQLP